MNVIIFLALWQFFTSALLLAPQRVAMPVALCSYSGAVLDGGVQALYLDVFSKDGHTKKSLNGNKISRSNLNEEEEISLVIASGITLGLVVLAALTFVNMQGRSRLHQGGQLLVVISLALNILLLFSIHFLSESRGCRVTGAVSLVWISVTWWIIIFITYQEGKNGLKMSDSETESVVEEDNLFF